jgi:hypothetical protein
MAAILTDAQLTFLAKTASWKFDLAIKDARNANDSVVFTGNGVPDLDKLIDRLDSINGLVNYKLTVDVGSLFTNTVIVTEDDVKALRAKFISIFGNVSRPGFPFDVALAQGTREIAPFVTFGSVFSGESQQLDPSTNPGLATPNPPGLQLHEDWQDFGDGRANMVPKRPIDQTPL